MADIAPELYEKIKESFEDNAKSDKKLNSLLEKLANGKATQEDISTYAEHIGSASSKALLEHMTADNLPDGRIYWNIAERTIKPSLKANYDKVNDYATQVLGVLDKADNIGLKAVQGEYPSERIKAIEDAACMVDKTLEEARKVLGEPVCNTTMAFADDFIKANSEFRYKAGLSPKIIRTDSHGCCKWCANLAGVYDYEAVRNGSDVFRRHDNCRCTVIFQNGSKRQNVHTKKWEDTATNIKPRSEVLKQNEFDALRRQARANGEPYDATEEWLYKAKPNTGKVLEAKSYTTPDGVRYEVDGVNVIVRYSKHEYEVANLLVDTYGGKIYMSPEIAGKYAGIRTADYIYNGERWDLKTTKFESKDPIRNLVKKKKGKIQAENFIIEIPDDFNDYDRIYNEVKTTFGAGNTRHVNKIAILQGNSFKKIYEK